MTIRSELETILLNWANTQPVRIPVAFENVPFDKPASNVSYLEVMWLTSIVKLTDVGATRERETGIMQVNCCVPLGTGAKIGDDLAQAIKDLFPVIPKIGTVSIERPANSARAITREDGFRVIPVSVSYRQERTII